MLAQKLHFQNCKEQKTEPRKLQTPARNCTMKTMTSWLPVPQHPLVSHVSNLSGSVCSLSSTDRLHTFLYHETDNGGVKTFDPGGITGGRPGYGRCLHYPGKAERARVWFVNLRVSPCIVSSSQGHLAQASRVLTEVSISILKQWAVLHWNTPLAFSW